MISDLGQEFPSHYKIHILAALLLIFYPLDNKIPWHKLSVWYWSGSLLYIIAPVYFNAQVGHVRIDIKLLMSLHNFLFVSLTVFHAIWMAYSDHDFRQLHSVGDIHPLSPIGLKQNQHSAGETSFILFGDWTIGLRLFLLNPSWA